MSLSRVEKLVPDATAAGIFGQVRADFAEVAKTFADNFTQRNELGGSLFLSLDGEVVADLWGGTIAEGGAAWDRDTICVAFSCTKAATALCLHILAERGDVDLDAPVHRYWPAFASGGKESITARMLLDHSAGLPAMRAPMKPDCLTDWDYMVSRLEHEEPFWEPGSRVGYHAVTFGFLVGEIVRRVSGRSLGRFFHEEIAVPIDLDFAIGLPESHEPRVAPIESFRPSKDEQDTPFLRAARERGTIPNLFIFNSGDWSQKGVNTRAGRAAEIGAAGGVTNARGLGKMFAALAEGGERIGLSPATVATFAQASSATHLDATLMAPSRFGPGFMLNMRKRPTPGGFESLVMGERAFGHVGMGGSIGFADPECRLGFGYVMNRHGGGLLLNPRGQSLVDATYRCLGYRSDRTGFWSRN